MQKPILILLLAIASISSCKQTKSDSAKVEDHTASKFRIKIFDDEALKVIDADAEIKVLANGFSWSEGPLWVNDGNYLLFSDIPNNKVYKLVDSDTSTFLKPSGFLGKNFKGREPGSNGLLINEKGALVLLQHGERQVAVMDAPLNNPKPNYITLADNYQGKKFNSPNDAAYDAEGNLYFTDPAYGLPKGLNDPNKELDFQGVFCLLKSGNVTLIDKDIEFPNGIGLSNNGKTLYVGQSNPKKAQWYKYDIVAPGKVENKQLFFDATPFVGKENFQGLPDGLKVNKEDYIFASAPGGVWIFNPKGVLLAQILTGKRTSNCALGLNEKKLFMTANNSILSVDLK